jgi:hypothetical protein
LVLSRPEPFLQHNNSGHPDDEALARAALYGGPDKTLCFNYATSRNLRWRDRDLQRKFGFRTVFPNGPTGGLTLTIA